MWARSQDVRESWEFYRITLESVTYTRTGWRIVSNCSRIAIHNGDVIDNGASDASPAYINAGWKFRYRIDKAVVPDAPWYGFELNRYSNKSSFRDARSNVLFVPYWAIGVLGSILPILWWLRFIRPTERSK